MKLRDSAPPSLPSPPTPRCGCLKPDLYLLFGQNVPLSDAHNVVLGQPEGTLKPKSCYCFFFFFLHNQSGTILQASISLHSLDLKPRCREVTGDTETTVGEAGFIIDTGQEDPEANILLYCTSSDRFAKTADLRRPARPKY